jgi:hypothetical protein
VASAPDDREAGGAELHRVLRPDVGVGPDRDAVDGEKRRAARRDGVLQRAHERPRVVLERDEHRLRRVEVAVQDERRHPETGVILAAQRAGAVAQAQAEHDLTVPGAPRAVRRLREVGRLDAEDHVRRDVGRRERVVLVGIEVREATAPLVAEQVHGSGARGVQPQLGGPVRGQPGHAAQPHGREVVRVRRSVQHQVEGVHRAVVVVVVRVVQEDGAALRGPGLLVVVVVRGGRLDHAVPVGVHVEVRAEQRSVPRVAERDAGRVHRVLHRPLQVQRETEPGRNVGQRHREVQRAVGCGRSREHDQDRVTAQAQRALAGGRGTGRGTPEQEGRGVRTRVLQRHGPRVSEQRRARAHRRDAGGAGGAGHLRRGRHHDGSGKQEDDQEADDRDASRHGRPRAQII